MTWQYKQNLKWNNNCIQLDCNAPTILPIFIMELNGLACSEEHLNDFGTRKQNLPTGILLRSDYGLCRQLKSDSSVYSRGQTHSQSQWKNNIKFSRASLFHLSPERWNQARFSPQVPSPRIYIPKVYFVFLLSTTSPPSLTGMQSNHFIGWRL